MQRRSGPDGLTKAMSKPNIIVIMTDDQGYGDLSCMGATDFRTPHLDEMAREGEGLRSGCKKPFGKPSEWCRQVEKRKRMLCPSDNSL